MELLAALRLHYLRWLLFDVGDGLTFQYQGIFDTDHGTTKVWR